MVAHEPSIVSDVMARDEWKKSVIPDNGKQHSWGTHWDLPINSAVFFSTEFVRGSIKEKRPAVTLVPKSKEEKSTRTRSLCGPSMTCSGGNARHA